MPKSITVHELKERMDSPQGAVILDVRAAGAFEEWRIQGNNVTTLNVQNSKLKQFGVEHFSEIPNDKEVITVCAQGVSAQETASMLNEAGYSAAFLEGGMSAWSTFYQPVKVAETDTLRLYQILRPAKGCLSYMVASRDEAVVIDASRHVDEYTKLAQDLGVKIRHVLDTHLHADHISGGHALAGAVGAQYWIGPSEMEGGTRSFAPLTDKLRIPFGDSSLEVIAVPTPGHTPGSTSFLIDGKFLISGDTIFVSGVGRPDLGGKAAEWSQLLYETVFTKLAPLPDETVVLPAHYADYREVNDRGFVGEPLGDIRNKNDILRQNNREKFTSEVAGRAGATPPNYETIVAINRGVKHVSSEEQTNLEIGPNRCAVKHTATA